MITFASSNKKKNNMDEKSKIPTPVISLIPLFVLSHCWLWLSLSSVEMHF